MDELYDKTYELEPVGSIEEKPFEGIAEYLLFSGNAKKYSLQASYRTASKEMVMMGFGRDSRSLDEVPKMLFLIEFDFKFCHDSITRYSISDIADNSYSVFDVLKDKELSFKSEQLSNIFQNNSPKKIDLAFSIEDSCGILISDIVSALNVGNTYLGVLNGRFSYNIYNKLPLPNKIDAFVSNN